MLIQREDNFQSYTGYKTRRYTVNMCRMSSGSIFRLGRPVDVFSRIKSGLDVTCNVITQWLRFPIRGFDSLSVCLCKLIKHTFVGPPKLRPYSSIEMNMCWAKRLLQLRFDFDSTAVRSRRGYSTTYVTTVGLCLSMCVLLH